MVFSIPLWNFFLRVFVFGGCSSFWLCPENGSRGSAIALTVLIGAAKVGGFTKSGNEQHRTINSHQHLALILPLNWFLHRPFVVICGTRTFCNR
jgi:hypothetical protein